MEQGQEDQSPGHCQQALIRAVVYVKCMATAWCWIVHDDPLGACNICKASLRIHIGGMKKDLSKLAQKAEVGLRYLAVLQ